MNTQPLVSVLTPCYNSGDYLEGCIQSVLAQDYPHIEHVIQDGGSRDGSLETLKRHGERIHWVSEPDKGQSDALNKALQRCRGDVVVVLNADDEFLPHAVSWAVACLAQYPEAAAVYGDQCVIDAEGHLVNEQRMHCDYDFEKVFCVELIPPAQAAFIRRESYEAVGWYVDVTRETCPDYEMWVRLGLKFPIRYVPEYVVRYRVHPGSQGGQAAWIDKMAQSKREVIDQVCTNPMASAAIRRLHRRAYGGVLWWSADVCLGQGDVRGGLARVARALAVYPHLRQWRKLPGYLLACSRTAHAARERQSRIPMDASEHRPGLESAK